MSFAEPDFILSTPPRSKEATTEKSAPEGSIPSFDQRSLERKLVRKLDLRIILPSCLIFIFCYLDVSNIVRYFIVNYIVQVYSLHRN